MTAILSDAIAEFAVVDQLFADKLKSEGDCIVWTGAKHTFGYGLVTRRFSGKRKVIGCHRYAYMLAHGSVDEGMCVCHSCDNPPCVNPEHLFQGTLDDNVQDMMNKSRHRVATGEDHYMSHLSDEDIPSIRWLRASGVSPVEIGKRYGISRQSVCDIVKFRTWVHVPKKPEGWLPPDIEGELIRQGWVKP